MKNVLIVGSWHLGSVVGACIADSGNNVFLWDQTPKTAEAWSLGKPPIQEPGLNEMVAKYWGKTLTWVKDLKQASQKADWIVLAYDTPVNDKDEIEFDIVEEGFNQVLKSGFSDHVHFFFTAQIPVGTSRKFLARVKEVNPNWDGFGFYMPENLRLGEAIKSFKTPDRMVIGVNTSSALEREQAIRQWRDLIQDQNTPINIMGLESAEMVKHALNAFLGTCVVFANEVSEICERTNADAWDVMGSLKQDSRVGPKAFLRPGLGFSGGTLARDVKTLSKLSLDTDENFFSNLYSVNQNRNMWILRQLKQHLGTLDGKKVVLLGITYKPFTSTVRRSPALEIGSLLKKNGLQCVALDPMADLGELSLSEQSALSFELAKSEQAAFEGSAAAVVVTEWPQFLDFNYDSLKNLMSKKLIIDSKNLFGKKSLPAEFKVLVPGKTN